MLKTIGFSKEALSMNRVYENSQLMKELVCRSRFQETPEKVKEVYGPLVFPAPGDDRPYITGCLVLSMDGRLGYEGSPSSRTLTSSNVLDLSGGLTDLWTLNLVRTYADAILFGSTTLQDEGEFTGHVYDPDLQAFRNSHRERFAPTPWNVIVTRTPEGLPWQHPMLTTPHIPVLLVIPEDKQHQLHTCPGGRFCYGVIDGKVHGSEREKLGQLLHDQEVEEGQVDPRHLVVTLPADNFADLKLLMPLLRKLGIQQMSVESPYWIWRFMEEKVLDEFFLTYTGVFAGGKSVPGREVGFMPEDRPLMELASLHLTDGTVLYSRQVLRYSKEQKNAKCEEEGHC